MNNTNPSKATAPNIGANRVITITKIRPSDMPLACPPKTQWNMHPRVFLNFNDNGEAVCPYCGAAYKLTGAHSAAH